MDSDSSGVEEILKSIVNEHKNEKGLPQLSKESIEGLYSLAYQYYEGGKYAESGKFFRFLTLINTQDKKNWMGLGASLQMQKEFSQAIQAYSVAAVLDQSDPYVHVWAADCFFALDEIDKGIQAVNSAILAAKMKKVYQQLLPELEIIRQAWVNKNSKLAQKN